MPNGDVLRARPLLTRLLALDAEFRKLPAGQCLRIRRLAGILGVSPRTVYRYIDYMKKYFSAPIRCERGKGYYYEGDAPRLGTIILEESELFAIFVAQKVLAQYRGTPYEAALQSAFKKVRDALADDVELRLDEWERRLSFSAGGALDVKPEIWEKLHQALGCGWTVKMHYYSAYRGERCWREVDPYFLFNVAGEWYLVGYCHLRGELRTFLPGRIEELELTDKAFEPPDNITLTDFLRDAFRVEVREGRMPQEVKIKFGPRAARYIRERRWHHTEAIEELPDGGLVLTLMVVGEDELIRWVLGYGAEAEVLEPAALREKVAAVAREMAAKYQN